LVCYPLECEHGHEWGPGRIIVSWQPCECVPLLLGNFNGSSWTASPSPLPSNTLVSIGSAASSPSHVWLFGTNYNAGNQPLILSHS